ncbi:MAG: iron-sulfur cluster assembly scaffold protein [Pseudomonadota bacterium]
MASDSDLMKLYSARILALAADAPDAPRLENPGATVKKRSPLCGSTVTVDLNLTDGQISAYGQEVKACALGQAAAAVVASGIVGASASDVREARDALHAMLKTGSDAPSAPFDGLEALRPAQDYKNRHASIMLALDASVEALDQIEATAQTQSA